METPLLDTEDHQPTLSSWVPDHFYNNTEDLDDGSDALLPEHARTMEDNRFRRLLEKRVAFPARDGGIQSFLQQTALLDDSTQQVSLGRVVLPPNVWVTVLASTCTVCGLASIGSSYWAPEWSQVAVHISGGPFDINSGPWPVQSTTLMSFMQQLDDNRSAWNLATVLQVLLWITSLVLPFIFMMGAPAWTVADATDGSAPLHGLRSVAECVTARGAMLYVYVSLLLAIPFHDMSWSGTTSQTQLSVVALPGSGLISFATGVGLAIATFMLLRWPRATKYVLRNDFDPFLPLNDDTALVEDTLHHPWRLLQDDSKEVAEDEEESVVPPMVALEEEPIAPTTSRPALIQAPVEEESPGHSVRCTASRVFPFWKTVLLYETGLFAVALYIPSLTLPLARWAVTGASTSPQVQRLVLWQLPQHFVPLSSASIPIGLVAMPTLFALPGLALKMACTVWFVSSGRKRSTWRSRLYCIHPGSASVVFAVAVVLIVPLMNRLLQFCPPIWTLHPCLVVEARLEPGAWVLLVQTIAQELFVAMTIAWS